MKLLKKLMFWRKPKMSEVVQNLVPAVIGTVIFSAIMEIIGRKTVEESYLWLESPHGKYYVFPFYEAMRIVRKHDWQIADTEPILSRWQHLKRFVMG